MILFKMQPLAHGNWHYIKPAGEAWAVENGRLLVPGYRWNKKLGCFNKQLIEYALADYEMVDLEEKDLPFGLSPLWEARRMRKKRQREHERLVKTLTFRGY